MIWTFDDSFYGPKTCAPLSSLQIYQNAKKIAPESKEVVEDTSLPTHEALTEYFQDQIQAWKETDMCKELVRILNQSALGHNISKIVGVSLGAI